MKLIASQYFTWHYSNYHWKWMWYSLNLLTISCWIEHKAKSEAISVRSPVRPTSENTLNDNCVHMQSYLFFYGTPFLSHKNQLCEVTQATTTTFLWCGCKYLTKLLTPVKWTQCGELLWLILLEPKHEMVFVFRIHIQMLDKIIREISLFCIFQQITQFQRFYLCLFVENQNKQPKTQHARDTFIRLAVECRQLNGPKFTLLSFLVDIFTSHWIQI